MLKFGTSNIGKVFAGTSAVAGVYSGNNLIWTNAVPDTVFNVSKITSDVYESSTTYNNCKFLMFRVLPFDNQTAEITYGGITKTVTGTTVTEVHFGQYGAEADDGTPDTGDITFKNVKQIGLGSFNSAKSSSSYCHCLNNIVEWGPLEIIGANLFDQTPLTSLTIGNRVKQVYGSAFKNCPNLINLTISASVENFTDFKSDATALASGAFDKINMNVTVDENNQYFSSQNGILYNKNKTVIYYIPSRVLSSTYTIPNGVTILGSGALKNNTILTTVNLNNVTQICASAFSGCSNLTTVNGLNNVTQIGITAFGSVPLSSVTLSANLSYIASNVFTNITNSITFNGYIGSQTSFQGISPFNNLVGTSSGISITCNANIPAYFFEKSSTTASHFKVSSLTLNNVSHIGNYAFSRVDFLGGQTLNIGDNALDVIGTGAFNGGLVTDTSGTEVSNYTVVLGPITSLGNYALQTFHTGTVKFTTEDEAPSTDDYKTIFGDISSLGSNFEILVPDQFHDQYYYAWEDLQPYITPYI